MPSEILKFKYKVIEKPRRKWIITKGCNESQKSEINEL